MTGLLDIGPLTEDISVSGGRFTLKLCGLTGEDIFYLLQKYPKLTDIIFSSGGEVREDVVLTDLAGEAMGLLAEVIACANKKRGDVAAIEIARQIAASDQMQIVESIFRMTFREGPIPFFQRVIRMLNLITPSVAEQATQSPASWSATLEGDEPRPIPGRPRLVR
jgi:hypothetical protein